MNRIPEPSLDHRILEDMIYGTIKSRLLQAAIDLKIFDCLRTARSASEAAKMLGSDPGNTNLLLKALTACGLLTFTGGRFESTPVSRIFLDTQSPSCISLWLTQASQTFTPILENLGKLVEKGPASEQPDAHMNSETMCEFYTHAHAQTELAGVAKRTAAIVKALPEYDGFTKMLDLGGGPGLNSVAVLQDHPRLKSTVFDRKSVVAIAQTYIDRFGMAERIETRWGDYNTDELGTGYDLILASDTLYYEGEVLERLTSRLFNALAPGGVMVGIHGVLNPERTGPEYMVLGMLPDALMNQGELPCTGFLAPALLKAGFSTVHTRQVKMISNEMEVDIARKSV